MQRIYFDYQLIIDNVDERDYGFDLFKIDSKRFEFAYSPAHIEEIANGDINKRLKYPKEEYLSFLSKLTQNKEIIYGDPNTYESISLLFKKDYSLMIVSEHPKDCFERVIRYIHKNELSNQGQLSVLSRGNRQFEGLSDKNISKIKTKINNQNILEKLKSENIKKKLLVKIVDTFILGQVITNLIKEGIPLNTLPNELALLIMQPRIDDLEIFKPLFSEFLYKIINGEDIFNQIKSNYPWVENFIDNVMKILLEEGFYIENTSKVISSLHDTTHCIYASYFDYFITRDKKLFEKVKIIYEFLNVPTKVIYADHEHRWTSNFVSSENV